MLEKLILSAIVAMTIPSIARAEDMSKAALAFVLLPEGAQKVSPTEWKLVTESCSERPRRPASDWRARCTHKELVLSITGPCTATLQRTEHLWWDGAKTDDRSNFVHAVQKFDFSKAGTFSIAREGNLAGTFSLFTRFSGDKGVVCSADDMAYGRRVTEPTELRCFTAMGDSFNAKPDDPDRLQRLNKAIAYYRENSCKGLPF